MCRTGRGLLANASRRDRPSVRFLDLTRPADAGPAASPRSVRRRGPSGPAGLEPHLIPLRAPTLSGARTAACVCFKGDRPNWKRAIPRRTSPCSEPRHQGVQGPSAGNGRPYPSSSSAARFDVRPGIPDCGESVDASGLEGPGRATQSMAGPRVGDMSYPSVSFRTVNGPLPDFVCRVALGPAMLKGRRAASAERTGRSGRLIASPARREGALCPPP